MTSEKQSIKEAEKVCGPSKGADSWIPEMLLPYSVFRIERARLNLLRKIKQLATKDSWFDLIGETTLLFERAVPEKGGKATKTNANFVHFTPYPTDQSKRATLKRQLMENSSKIKDWANAVAPNEKLASDDPERFFYELVILKSKLSIQGYLSSILMQYYFGAHSKPIAYFGSISRDEGIPVTAAKIDASYEHTPEIDGIKQAASNIGEAKDIQDDDDEISTDFLNIINGITSSHEIGVPKGPFALLAIPAYSINPRSHGENEIKGTAMGTFCGWIYFFCKPDIPIPKKLANDLLKQVLPLLDDFAGELLAGEAEEAIESNYQNNQLKFTPTEFLERHLHTFSGWEIANKEKDPEFSGGAFSWNVNGDAISIALKGNLYDNYKGEWITLKGLPTTQIPEQKESLDREILGYHMAYYFRSMYRELKNIHEVSRVEELEKYKHMLESLTAPLNGITSALSELQRDTQELRAVLYDPAKALFESSPRLKELFEPGQTVTVSPDIRLIVAHDPISYSEGHSFVNDQPGDGSKSWESGYMVLVIAICRIFGVDDKLRWSQNLESFRGSARSALEPFFRDDARAHEELRDDLFWLLELGNLDAIIKLGQDDIDKIQSAIKSIKATLFSPFKFDNSNWSLQAIALAIKPYAEDVVLENFGQSEFGWVEWKISRLAPFSYATLLDFIIGVCLSNSKRKVVSAEASSNETFPWDLKLQFSQAFKANENSLSDIRENIFPILCGLRDWRLLGANVGNWQGPFIEFANRCVGINCVSPTSSDPNPGDRSTATWSFNPERKWKDGEIIVLENTKNNTVFQISLRDNDNSKGELEIYWREMT